MTKKTKKEKKFIAEDEQVAAAKYMALSNLAMEDYIKRADNNLKEAYYMADNDLYNDTGTGANEEYRSWLKEIENGDSYCFDEWEKAKVGLKW